MEIETQKKQDMLRDDQAENYIQKEIEEYDHIIGASKRRNLLDMDYIEDIYQKPLPGDDCDNCELNRNKSIIVQPQQQQQFNKEKSKEDQQIMKSQGSEIAKSISGSSFRSQRNSSKFKKKKNMKSFMVQTPKNQVNQLNNNQLEILEEQEQMQQLKQINHLRVLVFILKFARQLKEQTSYQHFQQLQKFHYDIISDKSYYIKQEQQEKKFIFQTFKSIIIQSQIYYFIQNLKVFSPSNIYIIIWHSVILLMQLLQFIVIPFKAGFNVDLSTNFALFFITQLFPISIFLIEILLSFNLGYYEKGIVITNRQKIMKHYLSGQFIIDSITISSQIINLGLMNPWLDFIFLLRIQSSMSILKMLDEHFNIQQKFSSSYELIKLVIMIGFVAHITGCAFHFLTIVENSEITWITKIGLQQAETQTRYVNSLYYSFITMITVGYGDITPVTNIEKIFVIFITLISCGVFAYAVNTIGSIFRENSLKEAAFKYDITNYMITRDISKLVQIKVIKALEYVHQQEEKGHSKGEEILNSIQNNIREEVYTEFYGNILNQSKLFKLNFSDDCLKSLTLKMKETTVAPNEILFKKGDHDNRILFLLDGEIELYIQQRNNYNKQDLVLSTLTEKCIIGYNGFFAQVPRDNSARSLVISRLAYCKAEDFIQILKMYPKDYEKFCMIRDNILFYNKKIDQQCLSCKNFQHSIFNCPLLHLKVDKEFVILKENYSISQDRNKLFVRNQSRIKLHSLSDRDLARDDLIQFRCELIENFEPEENMIRSRKYLNDKEFYMEMPSIIQNDQGLLEIKLYDDSSLTNIDEEDYEEENKQSLDFIEQQLSNQPQPIQSSPQSQQLHKSLSINPEKMQQEDSEKELMHYASNISKQSKNTDLELHDLQDQQESEGSLQNNATRESFQMGRNMKRKATYKKMTISKENISAKMSKQERKSEREYNKSKSNYSHSKSIQSIKSQQQQQSPQKNLDSMVFKEKENQLYILDFDYAKEFEIYFPNNNYSKICEEDEKRLIRVKLKKLQNRTKKRTKQQNPGDAQQQIGNQNSRQRHSIRDSNQFTLFKNKELIKNRSVK